MDAVAAAQTFEAECYVDNFTCLGICGMQLAQILGHAVAVFVLGVFFETGVERRVAAHDQRWHHLGDAVANDVRVAKHTSGVAHRGSRFDGREGHDLGDMFIAVQVGHVPDHFVAISGVKVHVDIGH